VTLLRGTLRITTTDQSATIFHTGDAFFLNDQDSKGHQSLVQGEESVALLLVGLSSRDTSQSLSVATTTISHCEYGDAVNTFTNLLD